MNLTDMDLHPLTAGRLLAIRREVAGREGDELERAAVCNAQVLAEACYRAGEAAFVSGEDVLEQLTFREMEELLGRLGGQGGPGESRGTRTCNPQFDDEQFTRLQAGKDR